MRVLPKREGNPSPDPTCILILFEGSIDFKI